MGRMMHQSVPSYSLAQISSDLTRFGTDKCDYTVDWRVERTIAMGTM